MISQHALAASQTRPPCDRRCKSVGVLSPRLGQTVPCYAYRQGIDHR